MDEGQAKDNWTIGQLARHFRCSASSIRNWESKELIPRSRRTMGKHRRYDTTHYRAIAAIMGEPTTSQPAAG